MSDTDRERAIRLQQRLGQLTRLYERHGYLVFNLALRTTGDADSAATAAEQALLAHVDDEEGLVAGTVRAAIAAAPQARPPAAQRAVMALESVCGYDEAAVVAALGLAPADGGERLREAREAMAAELGAEPQAVADVLRRWPLTPPPDDLWERVFHSLQRRVQRELWGKRPLDVLSPVPAERAGASSEPRRVVRRRLAVGLTVLLAAGVGALYGTGIGFSDPSSPQAPQAAPPAAPPPVAGEPEPRSVVPAPVAREAVPERDEPTSDRSPLTPDELDKLRRQELRELAQAARRRRDDSLPARDRADATRDIARIRALAQTRLRAAERRERALRRELARERASRARAEARERTERAARGRDQARRSRRDREERASERPPAQKEVPATTAPPASAEPGGQQLEECTVDPATGEYACGG